MKQNIVLGTVQLGLPYGINNVAGKPSADEAFQILDIAFHEGIHTLDTADGYGDSIQVIGHFIHTTDRKFRIINKFKVDSTPINKKVNDNLETLNNSSLYCYMYHQFSDYSAGLVKRELMKLKEKGIVEKTGLSIYTTDQLIQAIDDPNVDIIQLPVNILDLTVEKKALLSKAREKGKEIHARSVYLQGLLLMDPSTLTGNMINLKPYLIHLKNLAIQKKTSVKEMALNYVMQQDCIDAVVLGVETVNQLKENLFAVNPNVDLTSIEFPEVAAKDISLLNPSNWKS